MPYDQIIKASLALAGLAIAAIITFWHKILDWAHSSLFPWIEKNLPTLTNIVKDAFTWIDDKVVVPIRRVVKAAWNALRQQLLRMTAHFERQSQSKWVKRITFWVIEVLDSPKPKIKQTEVYEELDWDDLPQGAKAAWLKNNQSSHELDITEARDQELASLEMVN